MYNNIINYKMGKVKSTAKKWVKQAVRDIKKDPEVIDRTIGRTKNRVQNVQLKAMGAIAKGKAGDILGAMKGAQSAYRAAVGGKMHKKLLESDKVYRRAHNIGGKTFKAAEAFQSGDHKMGYKHALDAARAAVGKAKLEQVKSNKVAREALAAVNGFRKAAGLPKEADALDKLKAGISGYTEKKKQQKKKMDARKPIPETQLLGRNN
jgi:hypothetical protein